MDVVKLFNNDEAGYLDWISEHPSGYVGNVDRAKHVPNYPMVHKATHATVSSERIGNFTTGDYIKFCSTDLDALEAFSQQNYQRSLTPCAHCMGSGSISAFFNDRLGAPFRNIRWSWGSVDDVRRIVFLRVWDNEIREHDGRRWIRVLSGDGGARPGWRERQQHLELVDSGYAAYGVLCTRARPGEAVIGKFDSARLLRFGTILRSGDTREIEILGDVPLERLAPIGAVPDALEDTDPAWSEGPETTRAALVDARLGQGQFRRLVLEKWGNACAVTGCTVQAALRASHCKPWRISDNRERLDPLNGLPLVANLDALFDVGLISFDSAGDMLVCSRITAEERAMLGVPTSLRKRPSKAMVAYLAHHRQHVFLGDIVG